MKFYVTALLLSGAAAGNFYSFFTIGEDFWKTKGKELGNINFSGKTGTLCSTVGEEGKCTEQGAVCGLATMLPEDATADT